MVTIKEIAEKLGVSPTTVSNVINGRTGKMSEDTRKKVEEALVSCHYVNDSRREDPSAEIKLISMDFCLGEERDIFTDPFCSRLMEGLIKELRAYGRYVVSDTSGSDEEIMRKLSARNVEGGILLGYRAEKCESLRKRIAKPIVFIDSGDGDYDNIGLQEEEGAYEITSYLIRQGHNRIAFFYNYIDTSVSDRSRFEGFRKAKLRHGFSVEEGDCYTLPFDKHLRHEFLRKFAREKAGKYYTAAFFVSDLIANEAVSQFFSQGISVPGHISVTGFDDNMYARLSRPPLTTVRQNPEEKACEAVKMLMKRIYGEEVLVRSLHLPTELIVRESVRNIGGRI